MAEFWAGQRVASQPAPFPQPEPKKLQRPPHPQPERNPLVIPSLFAYLAVCVFVRDYSHGVPHRSVKSSGDHTAKREFPATGVGEIKACCENSMIKFSQPPTPQNQCWWNLRVRWSGEIKACLCQTPVRASLPNIDFGGRGDFKRRPFFCIQAFISPTPDSYFSAKKNIFDLKHNHAVVIVVVGCRCLYWCWRPRLRGCGTLVVRSQQKTCATCRAVLLCCRARPRLDARKGGKRPTYSQSGYRGVVCACNPCIEPSVFMSEDLGFSYFLIIS